MAAVPGAGKEQTTPRSQRSYRMLLVITDPDQEPHLRRYVKALTNSQAADIGVLRVCRPQGDSTSAGCAELPSHDDPDAVMVHQLDHNQDLTTRILAVADRWPFDMVISRWPEEDDDVAVYARLVQKIDATAVLVQHSDRPLRRVLVPAGGGAHALEGVRVADALARAWSLETQVLRIVQPGKDFWLRKTELKRQCRHIRNATRLYVDVAGVEMPVRVRLGSDVAEEIIRNSRPDDLIVIGGSGQWLMEHYASTSIPIRVADGAAGPVMMVLTSRGRPDTLTDVFWERTIRVGLHAPDKQIALEMLVDALVAGRQVPAVRRDEIVKAALDREQICATYVGYDTAIPHAAMTGFRGLVGILGVFPEGVPFGKSADERARFVFLLLAPKESYEVYLTILARIARFMNESDHRRRLAQADSPTEVVEIMAQAERKWQIAAC